VPPKDEVFAERKVGILLVEDNEDDAYFILSALTKGGIAHVSKCVSQRDEFIAALAEFKPDLVLSDYKLPEFAEMEPLHIVRERSPDLPFILVTGALGEELSVEIMKEGATDYILKDRLFRLVPAVERALRETEERRRRREGDELLKKQHEQLQRQNEALRRAEENYRSIYENAIEGIFQTTPEGRYLSANPALARMLGYASPEDLMASIRDIGSQMCVRAESRLELKRRLEADGQVRGFENQIRRKDGRTIWISVNAHIVRDADGKVLYYEGTSQDITERKQLEQEVIETSANERRRVGHELHDGLGQYLAGIAFKAKALEQSLVAESLPHGAEAKELAALVSNAISQTRSLARGLDPIEVETIGLQAALENLAVETQKFFNVSCRFQCSENVPEVDPQVSLALYRVVQEAIHNGITHGEARSIEIELGMNGSNLCLRVQDDGTGFQAEESRQGGIGLRVMQYRARSIGGSLQVNSQPQRGTEVQCVVPRRNGLSGKVEANQETSEESDGGNEQGISETSRPI